MSHDTTTSLLSLLEDAPETAPEGTFDSERGQLRWSATEIAFEETVGEVLALDASSLVSIQLSRAREMLRQGLVGRLKKRAGAGGVRWWVLAQLRGRAGQRMRLRAQVSELSLIEGLPEEQLIGLSLDYEPLVSLLMCARALGGSLVRVKLEALEAVAVQRSARYTMNRTVDHARHAHPLVRGERYRDRLMKRFGDAGVVERCERLQRLEQEITELVEQRRLLPTRDGKALLVDLIRRKKRFASEEALLKAQVAELSEIFPPLNLARDLERFRRDVHNVLRAHKLSESAREKWRHRIWELVSQIMRVWLPEVELNRLLHELSEPDVCEARAAQEEDALEIPWLSDPMYGWKPVGAIHFASIIARLLVDQGYPELCRRLRDGELEAEEAGRGAQALVLMLHRALSFYPPLDIVMKLHGVRTALSRTRVVTDAVLIRDGKSAPRKVLGGGYFLVTALERTSGALRDSFDGLELPSRLLGLAVPKQKPEAELLPLVEALEDAGASRICEQVLERCEVLGWLQSLRRAGVERIGESAVTDALEDHAHRLTASREALMALTRETRRRFPLLALHDGVVLIRQRMFTFAPERVDGTRIVSGQAEVLGVIDDMMRALSHFGFDGDLEALIHATACAAHEDAQPPRPITLDMPPSSPERIAAFLALTLRKTRFQSLYEQGDARHKKIFLRATRNYTPVELVRRLERVKAAVLRVRVRAPLGVLAHVAHKSTAERAARAWAARFYELFGPQFDAISTLNAWSSMVVLSSTRYWETTPDESNE